MARKADPRTPYIVRGGVNNGYRYAYIQRMVPVDMDSGLQTLARRKVQLGTLTENNVFTPNKTFRLMDIDERRKLIFPEEWDISAAKVLDAGKRKADAESNRSGADTVNPEDKCANMSEVKKGNGTESKGETVTLDSDESIKPAEQVQVNVETRNFFYRSRIYGGVWLLEQVAEKKGLVEDLLEVFNGDIGATNDVLTLAIYSIIESRSFNRLDRWLDTHKALSDHRFGSDYVTRFTQSINDNHRMKLIGLRLERQPQGAVGSIDSSTRSGYGKCLVNLKYGHNKDRDDLPCTLEVYVYSLTTHEPIYYKRMAGNTSDMVTIRTIINDMEELGVKEDDLSFMTDRGYCSKENMGIFHRMGAPFLMCAKVNQAPVADCLRKIEYNKVGLPVNMEYDEQSRLYYAQTDAEDFEVTLDTGKVHQVHGIKVNMYMNPDKRLADATRVNLAIKEEKARIDEYSSGKTSASSLKSFNASLKYHRGSLNQDTGKVTFSYKQDAEDKAYAQCGFFASCMYKQDMNAIEAYREYKTRDEHEKNFYGLKQDEGADMQDCSSEEGSEGRAFIYFVGLIMLNTLKRTWKMKLKGKFNSTYEVLDTMEPICFSEYTSGNFHMTTFNSEQIDICDAFGITPPLECLTSTAKEQWRRKTNPKKRGPKGKCSNKVENN